MNRKRNNPRAFPFSSLGAARPLKQLIKKYAPSSVLLIAQKIYRHLRSQRSTSHSNQLDYPDIAQILSGRAKQAPRFRDVTAAAILDEFSHAAWAPEFNLIRVTPQNWRGEVKQEIDLLLVESAWMGNDSAWQYHLTGSRAPSSDLIELVLVCKERGIPTVFWNKEDPPHFKDFLETAKLFDIVFTTDINMVDRYKTLLNHDQVYVLPFAAQPRFHTPARNGMGQKQGGIAFAGTYFRHKFPERRAQMDLLLGAADQVSQNYGVPFTIFSRHEGKEEKYQFPHPLSKYVVGSLTYNRMLVAYKSFDLFLNVNSVTDSPSMCSRRIFEILASGTPVVSTESSAIPEFFSDEEVPVVRSFEEAVHTIRSLIESPELRDRMLHKAQRKVWLHHTYRHRAEIILEKCCISSNAPDSELISIICPTYRPDSIEHILKQIGHQTVPKFEVLLLTHGFELDLEELQASARKVGIQNVRLLSAPVEWSLGQCLNYLVETADGDIIAKFDDDDYYAPNYLLDQCAALDYSDADLVGKASIFFYLEGNNCIARRWAQKEHKWVDFVAGATFVGPKKTFVETPFQELRVGEDSAFLMDLREKGRSIYSTDRFNYMAVRRDSDSHTWNISDQQILSYSRIETFGLNLAHIEV